MPDQSSAASEHAIIQEITGPLQNLPDDPVALVHAEFPIVMRGYDRAAVDGYMRQMSQLVAELQATRSPEAAVRRALERVGEQISGILQRAHETAEQITAQSRREAEDRLERARAEGDQIAGAAEQRVKELDTDTDRIWLERQRIVADAEDLAAQLVALAKSAVERFPDDEQAGDEPRGDEPGDYGQGDYGQGGYGQADDEPAATATDDRTAPYDDDAVPSVAPPPSFPADHARDEPGGRSPAGTVPVGDAEPTPHAEPTPYADAGDEEQGFGDDYEPGPAFDDSQETVAFQPLTPGEGDDASAEDDARGAAGTAEGSGRAQPPSAPAAGDGPRAGTPADAESTAIIPPASQAAHRRRRS